jgi:hypothetical protein
MGLCLALGGTAVGGCVGEAVEDENASVDDVTDVSHTAVRRQSIGNCWLYAAVGWVESILRRQTNAENNISESYLTYWDWYEKIQRGDFEGSGGALEIQTGGHWGSAVDLMLRRGIVAEGDFLPEEAALEMSAAQSRALGIINESLRNGALKSAEARRNRTLIRTELNRAFGISTAVIAKMDGLFGADGARTLSTTNTDWAQHPRTINAGTWRSRTSATRRSVKLADLMGTNRSSWDPDKREGAYAWNGVAYPSWSATERTNVLRRVARALNDGHPVAISWLVDFNALNNNGTFALSELTTRGPGRQGGHLTVMEDYAVTNAPGFGDLDFGALSAEQRAAAVNGTISRFLIKNSWGASRPDRASQNGYYVLDMAYLNGPIRWSSGTPAPGTTPSYSSRTPLSSFVLPAGY